MTTAPRLGPTSDLPPRTTTPVAVTDDGRIRVYHELQYASLCAVHALNSALQGPFFTEVDLAEIAQGFDARERQVMAEAGTESAEFLKFVAQESANVADDGNYSSQVITAALETFGVSCTPITSPDMREARDNPLGETAFLCNQAAHWLTIRRIGGFFWNLNSLLKEPQYTSDFYLSAYLDSLQAKGYTIFVLRGDFPTSPSVLANSRTENWHYCFPRVAPTKLAANNAARRRRDAEDAAADPHLRAVLEASKAMADEGDDEILAAAIAQSMAAAGGGGGGGGSGGGAGAGGATGGAAGGGVDDEDEELRLALELSRQQG